MADIQTSEVDTTLAPVNLEQILCAERSSNDERILYDHFCEKTKYEHGGLLKVNIHVSFYGDNQESSPRSSEWSLNFTLPNQNVVFLISLMRAASSSHFSLLILIILIIFGEEYTL
jgi:hypothetical protein